MIKPFRILSLSGGGIRGIFQAVFLSNLEKQLGEPLSKYFDLISGTSTGSIIGMGVACGIPCDEIVDLYKKHGHKIFNKRFLAEFRKGPVYEQKILRNELFQIFGDIKLKDVQTKVLITSASMNNFNHKVFTNFKTFGMKDDDLSVIDIVLSSSAAPTYFMPVKPVGDDRHFIDGGVWANSPSAISILFANKYLNVPISNIKLISIGNGDFPPNTTIKYFQRLVQYSSKAVKTIFELMFASQASFADQYSKEILSDENYIRVTANLSEEIALDDIDKALSKLPGLAAIAFDNTYEKIRKLIMHEQKPIIYKQKVDRDNLIPYELIHDTGLTAFFPSREYYSYRGDASSTIHGYVNTATESLIMVSVSLVKGINFENLRTVLTRKLEAPDGNFKVTISLLNPNKKYLMQSLCLVFGKRSNDIATEIKDGMDKLKILKQSLSEDAQNRFELRYHNSIPFGSAIMIDYDKPYGKIQIETKAYSVPAIKSFAFEVIPIKEDGYYDTLLEGYKELIKQGEPIN